MNATPLERALKVTHDGVRLVLRAPAALLLGGEYFVTERHGQGLSLAVEPYAHCTLRWHGAQAQDKGHAAVMLTLRFGDETRVFENASEDELYKHCETCAAPYLSLYTAQALPREKRLHICVDTRAFYTHTSGEVRKRGLGSSECAALLMCAALALCNGKDPLTNPKALASHAAHAHYAWQGGCGSGYGAWTSVFGGMGIYTNGSLTETGGARWHGAWRSVPQALTQLPWWFWNCEAAQSSQKAMQYYHAWKHEHPREAREFSAQYRELFITLERELWEHGRAKQHETSASLIKSLERAKALGVWIGDAIGVSARLANEQSMQRAMCMYKAVGAGNECAVGVSYNAACETQALGSALGLRVAKGMAYGE